MVTRNSTDSSNSALGPMDWRRALDTNNTGTPDVCPPSLPNCGPEPGAQDPEQASPERAAPTAR